MEAAARTSDRPLTVESATDVQGAVEPLFREYGEWVAARLQETLGVTFSAADQDRHHEAFRAELPRLRGPRGRLLVARLGAEPVGVGALKPVDDTTAEIKRMYVRPAAHGLGAGRAILDRLVADATALGYTAVRLETLQFMTAAQGLYRASGFVECPLFTGSEAAGTVFEPLTIAMSRRLGAG